MLFPTDKTSLFATAPCRMPIQILRKNSVRNPRTMRADTASKSIAFRIWYWTLYSPRKAWSRWKCRWEAPTDTNSSSNRRIFTTIIILPQHPDIMEGKWRSAVKLLCWLRHVRRQYVFTHPLARISWILSIARRCNIKKFRLQESEVSERSKIFIWPTFSNFTNCQPLPSAKVQLPKRPYLHKAAQKLRQTLRGHKSTLQIAGIYDI